MQKYACRLNETVPMIPGAVALYCPTGISGENGPTDAMSNVAGRLFKTGGGMLGCNRDPAYMLTFCLDISNGAATLDFHFLTPAGDS